MSQPNITSFFGKRRGEGEESEAKKAKVNREAAVSLLSSLTCAEWRAALERETEKDYLSRLAEFVEKERGKGPVYPPAESVFAALNACPLSAVKVVVVGQDPYHGPGQAHGLAFSIAKGARCKFPPSLRNILDEVSDDVKASKSSGGDLMPWAERGVLLLNAVLTVRGGAANSHQNKGWERFTDAVISAVNTRCPGVVFLLWGKPAQTKCASINKKKHRVLASSHPSPLSNTKTKSPFTGSRCFSKCNDLLLTDLGHDSAVNWDLAPE